MIKFERLFIGVVLGSISPILLFVTGWWTTYKNPLTVYFALTGLVTGLLIDLFFLKRWISKAYDLPKWLLVGIFLFYSVGLYGFFMGFPVFNLFMGFIAGYYYGNRMHRDKISPSQSQSLIRQVSFFTALVMTFFCISTAFLALRESSINSEVQHMLGLPFEVTDPMIWGIVLFGGLGLIGLQYYLTQKVMIYTLNHHR